MQQWDWGCLKPKNIKTSSLSLMSTLKWSMALRRLHFVIPSNRKTCWHHTLQVSSGLFLSLFLWMVMLISGLVLICFLEPHAFVMNDGWSFSQLLIVIRAFHRDACCHFNQSCHKWLMRLAVAAGPAMWLVRKKKSGWSCWQNRRMRNSYFT